ncbi:MAG TPA: GntR family transcriptional regulator [Bryobacteraceae bacterium]|nr:GntR family transcriptional regulator [Bryobacteraceae bacterium]
MQNGKGLNRAAAGPQASSQTSRATLALREMIIRGDFRPVERIREIPLAAKLKVSRIPLRLALDRLANEGLLELRPTRGFIVPQFSRADIYDAIELRGSLEGTAARLAAERVRDGKDLEQMRDLTAQMETLIRPRKLTLESFTRYIDLNAKFHAALMALSQSRILRRAMERACSLPFASPSAFLLRQHGEEPKDLFLIAVDHHRSIADAIENGEGMRAETLAREHARLARRNLDTALGNEELLRFVPGSKLIKL